MSQAEFLLNGNLGEPFYAVGGDTQRITAVGWMSWWLPPRPDDPNWKHRQPVFSNFTMDNRPVQQLTTPWGTHVGGLWQQAPAAPGNRYELTVEGQAWSSDEPTPGSRVEGSDVNLQIGIDPTGGVDPESPLIQWSAVAQPLSHWETLHLTADAETTTITIYLKSAPNLPKRQQSVFWRNAFLRPIGRHKRSVNIIGAGDTYITLEPEHPHPGEAVQVKVSSTREHRQVDLLVKDAAEVLTAVSPLGHTVDGERHVWRYDFTAVADGLYEVRFVGDKGARLLALRLLQVARDMQLVPSDASRLNYQRIYVLLPPTADVHWFMAAARGGFNGRFTIGFSADDAGVGDLTHKQVIAVNPHHWPEVLTPSWFQQHYPGVKFTAVVANRPDDLEAWLRKWFETQN
ncbi:MAG: hypothetical protein IPM39_12620 [Chloroflexi bacterium]|nr:hypothetical protein [Chloroflexota bacterium]